MKKKILLFLVFSLLAGLGSWQLYRLDYKNSLIQSIKENSNLSPVQTSALDLKHNIYKNISIKGKLSNSKTIFYYRLKNNIPGYEVITPLILENGDALLVSRGWVKDQVNMNGAKNIRIQGYLIEIYKSNIGSPKNNIRKNIWFDLDSAALKAHMSISNVLPFVLLLKFPEVFTVGEQDLGFDIHNLPNNHLGYAITWFTLAFVLLIIIFIDYRNRGKNEGL